MKKIKYLLLLLLLLTVGCGNTKDNKKKYSIFLYFNQDGKK